MSENERKEEWKGAAYSFMTSVSVLRFGELHDATVDQSLASFSLHQGLQIG